MHSLIERRTKCDIFTTREYMLAMEIARETPSAYKVTEVQFSDTKKVVKRLFEVCSSREERR